MNCTTKGSDYCVNNISLYLTCLYRLYQNEQSVITLQLNDIDNNPIDLNTISSIEIVVYDTRQFPLIRYVYPSVQKSSNSYFYDIYDFTDHRLWFDNYDINILQFTLDGDLSTDIYNETDNTYSSTYGDTDDTFINKGKISFIINEDMSKYLMIGLVYVDVKIVYNNQMIMVKCFNIGILEKNKFAEYVAK